MMKRLCCIMVFLLLLCGCAAKEQDMERVMALRAKLLASPEVSFDAVVTADYGAHTYTFKLRCKTASTGELTFEVLEPESIAGITGKASVNGGKLTFDDKALSFGPLADGSVAPVSGPWIIMNTLRSGYLTSCGEENGSLRVSIDDSYADDALHLDIWMDEKDLPARGDVLWQGRRILSIEIENFVIG